jgi:hypothetical protein
VRRKAVALLTTLLFCGAARADLRLEFEGEDPDGFFATAIAGSMIRIDQGPDFSAIFDATTGNLIALDHRERRFIRVGSREIEALAAAFRSAIAEIERATTDGPADVRAEFEAVFGGAPGRTPLLVVVEVGDDTIEGIVCRRHRVEMLGRPFAELCLARLEDLPGLTAEEREALQAFLSFAEPVYATLRDGKFAAALAPAFDLDGFPIREIDLTGEGSGNIALTRISRESQPKALFEVPAHYTEDDFVIPSMFLYPWQ